MGFEEFMETYGSGLLLFIIMLGYIFLKKFLTQKRMDNRKNCFDEPEEIARLSIAEYRKKNPEMLIRFSNVTTIKELITHQMARIVSVVS